MTLSPQHVGTGGLTWFQVSLLYFAAEVWTQAAKWLPDESKRTGCVTEHASDKGK